jgi:hypothetical protein
MPIPVPVQRLLSIAALAEGISMDEYVLRLLSDRADQIRTSEVRAEYTDIRLERQARAYKPMGITKPQRRIEEGRNRAPDRTAEAPQDRAAN